MDMLNKLKLAVPALAIMLMTSGCKDDDDGNTLAASFEVSSTEININSSVEFTNTSDNATYYIWDFGDGNTSNETNPVHTYEVAGEFEASLTAIGGSSSDTAKKTITVSATNVSIYEGTGITDVTLFETVWSDLNDQFGSDTSFYTYYSESDGYYFVASYDDEGMAFYLYANGGKTLTKSAYVYAVSLYGANYSGGTTSKGIGIGSSLTAMKSAYGDPEDTVTGTYNSYTYTYYQYPSVGVDFLDFDEDQIYEIDIYQSSETTKSVKSLSSSEIKEHLYKHRIERLKH